MWACEPEQRHVICSCMQHVWNSSQFAFHFHFPADKLQYWTSKLNVMNITKYHKIKIQILLTIFHFYSVCFRYAVINHHVLESKLAWIHVKVCFIYIFRVIMVTHNGKVWVYLLYTDLFSSTSWWMQLKWHLTTPTRRLRQSKMHIRGSAISYVSGSLLLHCWTS